MEIEPMNEELSKAITSLTKKSETAERADDAMKYAQAALNLSHALATVKAADR
jgi:hypothetical protein